MSPRITATRGTLLGQSFPLMGELTIGRDASNSIPVADTQVSRHHCRVAGSGDQFLVEDLGSSNGTFVNERRITGSFDIYPGDRIRVGATEFVLEVQDPASARPRETSRLQEGPRQAPQPGSILPPVRPMGSAWQAPDLSFLTSAIDGCVSSIVRFFAGLLKFLPYLALICICICAMSMLARLGLGLLSCGANGIANQANKQDQGSQQGQTQPPQGQTPPAQEENDSGIEIISARVVQVTRMPLPNQINVLVVKWRNRTGHPVRQIKADVQCYDAKGGFSITKPFVEVYNGQPVADGAVHEDTESSGVLLDLVGVGATPPATAKLENFTVR